MIVPELQRVLVQAARAEEAVAVAAPRRDDATTHGLRRGLRGPALSPYARLRARVLWQGRRGWRWRALPVLALLVLAGSAGAFASGLISFGAPVPSVPLFAKPDAGLGKIVPGGAHLVALSVADPRGGPRWGMRVIETTRGVGCLQVGRLVGGKLVALGQDGAFGDDSLAHALPPSAGIQRMDCALLDARGRIFESITRKSEPASAAPGEYCYPPGTYAPSHSSTTLPACPLADERNLYYGMLGPDVKSITYSAGGRTRTVPTVGPEGAYLIVTTGTTHRYTGAAGRLELDGLAERDSLADRDVVPVYSPISTIHYKGGTTCHLATAKKWIYGRRSCTPSLHEPFGYVKPATPTRAQIATPIHAKLFHGPKGRPEIAISFASPVAISTLRGEYYLTWHEPGMARDVNATGPLEQGRFFRGSGLIPQTPNIAAGQVVTGTIGQFSIRRPIPPGVTTGQVFLTYAVGPLMQTAEDTVKIPVGSFEVTVR